MTEAILHFTNGDSVEISAPKFEKVMECLGGNNEITLRGSDGERIAPVPQNINYVEEGSN